MQATLGWRQKQCPLDAYSARLRGSDEDWKLKVDALRDIDSYVQENAATITQENLSCLVVPFRSLFVELRSAVVKEACEVFANIATHTGQKMKILLSNVFATLIDGRGSTNKVNSLAIHSCIERVLKVVMSRHILSTFFYVSKNSKNGQMRDSCVQYLLIVLQNWTKQHLDPHRSQIQDFIINALSDASPISREVARVCYGPYSNIWPEYNEAFLQTLEPSVKKYLVKQAESAEKSQTPTTANSTDINTPVVRESSTRNSIRQLNQGKKRKILTNITNTPDTIKRRKNAILSKLNSLPMRVPLARKAQTIDAENQSKDSASEQASSKATLTVDSNHETLKSVSPTSLQIVQTDQTTNSCTPDLYFNLVCEKKLVEKTLSNLQQKLASKCDELLQAQETIESLKMLGEDQAKDQDSTNMILLQESTIAQLQKQVHYMENALKEKDKTILHLQMQLDASNAIQNCNCAKTSDSTLKEIPSPVSEGNSTVVSAQDEIEALKDDLTRVQKQNEVLETELLSMDESISTIQAALQEEQQQVERLKAENFQLRQVNVNSVQCQCNDTVKAIEMKLMQSLAKELALQNQLSESVAELSQLQMQMDDFVKESNQHQNSENSRLVQELQTLQGKMKQSDLLWEEKLKRIDSQNKLNLQSIQQEKSKQNDASWEEKLRRIESEHKAKEAATQRDIFRLEEEIKFHCIAAQALQSENDNLASSLSVAKAEYENSLAKLNGMAILLRQYEDATNVNQDKFITVELELGQMRADKEHWEKLAQEMSIKVKDLNDSVASLQATIHDANATNSTLSNAVNQLKSELKELTDERDQLSETHRETLEELDQTEDCSRQLKQDVVWHKDRLQELLSEKNDLQNQIQHLTSVHDEQVIALQEEDFQRQFQYENQIKEKNALIKRLEQENCQLQNEIASMREINDDLSLQYETLETRAFVTSSESDDRIRKLKLEQDTLLTEKEALVQNINRLAKECSEWKSSSDAKQMTIQEFEIRVVLLESTIESWCGKEKMWMETKSKLEKSITKALETISSHESTIQSLQQALNSSEVRIAEVNAEQDELRQEKEKLLQDYNTISKAMRDLEIKKTQLQNQLISGLERYRDSKIIKHEVIDPPPKTEIVIPVKEEIAPVVPSIDKSWKLKLSATPSLFPQKQAFKASMQIC
ncbi:hypothetical protein THRCLA_02436 [Thraustotheca clavata]|uniref:TOG domain-containing protein n=1 Tax=Thraustotheca clavata TaxID=74557 RepID=A0A1W0A561_9STRA|nr:hypothetical protein THRCLA_02436 [Thraustotheca clavata]